MEIRDKAVNAVDVLNDLVADLITGTNVLRDYHALHKRSKLPTELMVGVQKMCLSHLILGCCKFIEFYEHFHDILPTEDRMRAKALVRKFDSRGMVDFRNKVVGHIWDKSKRRPLLLSEITKSLEKITERNLHTFLDWINKLEARSQPESVAGIVEAIRGKLVIMYVISPDEVLNR